MNFPKWTGTRIDAEALKELRRREVDPNEPNNSIIRRLLGLQPLPHGHHRRGGRPKIQESRLSPGELEGFEDKLAPQE